MGKRVPGRRNSQSKACGNMPGMFKAAYVAQLAWEESEVGDEIPEVMGPKHQVNVFNVQEGQV